MSDFILNSSTRALASSVEASHLLEQKQRVEQAVIQNDSALTLDTAKAFLESTFKTILNDRTDTQISNQKLNQLYKEVRTNLCLNRDEQAQIILEKLTNPIVNGISELRNQFGAASHGDDGYFENPIEMPEAEMVANLVDSMVGFLYRKHKADGDPELAQRIYYNDYPEFNSFLDLQYDSYQLKLGEKGVVELTPSELIFQHDKSLYLEMLVQYRSTEEEDNETDIQQLKQIENNEVIDEVNINSKNIFNTESALQELNAILSECSIFSDTLNDQQKLSLTNFIVDYALNKTEVDWQNREPTIAKFRTQIRRQIKKLGVNKDLVDSAVDFLINKAIDFFPNEQGK